MHSKLPFGCLAAIVLLQTSYVPSLTTHRFIMEESVMSGFQSSKEFSKSSAKRKQRLENLPLLTNEPELQAEKYHQYKTIAIYLEIT